MQQFRGALKIFMLILGFVFCSGCFAGINSLSRFRVLIEKDNGLKGGNGPLPRGLVNRWERMASGETLLDCN